MKKRILILTTGWGHLSLAEAAAEAFQKNQWEVKIYQHNFRAMAMAYNSVYLFFPRFWRFFYRFFSTKHLQKTITLFNKSLQPRAILNQVKQYRPDLILSTHCVFNPFLVKNKAKYQYRLLSLIADSRNTYQYYFSPQIDLHFLYDEKLKKRLSLGQIGEKKIMIIGWLVRNKFYDQKKSRSKIKKPLKIVLIAGSFGTNSLLKFLPIFQKNRNNIELTIITGKSKIFYQTLKSYCQINKMKYKLYRFTSNIATIMSKADLIAGKAGPNILFESVALSKPFICLTHLHGQEDGNLEIIKEKSLGWVTEKPKQLEELLDKILNNPQLIIQKRKSISQERKRNKSAGQKITKATEKLFSNL
ncbi:MAG: glycosyltransferase [Candidatus Shapirobacteria bacterium]